ncbi:MAG: type II toxin-antitoxin system HipA family toxin [Mariprofundaceae bacterium]|nr:type II toxin-antitoxin system HipA family toxin [Mariprofundaceae bacterium]
MSNALDIYLLKAHVGRLTLDEKRKFLFQYEKSWVECSHALPLSLSLPLQYAAFENDVARSFFANLLPESELRKVISLQLGVSQSNDFALLEAVGGECAGAVTLLPVGELWSDDGEYQALNDHTLNRLVREMPQKPMLVGEGDIRLSLAGAQNKLPVFYDNGVVSLTKGHVPSSHILKPPMEHFLNSVENEMFCMQLAKKMGLNVPKVTLLQKEQPLYLIERYDRLRNANGEIVRLHQEDFCQALGVASEMKYQNEGGPSLQTCFQLIRDYSINPIADVNALLQWTIFNYLIGNADAHGKNISILFTQQGPKLAPFYDLLSTAIYPDLNSKAAMKIGGEYRPEWIAIRHWQRFSEHIGVNSSIVFQNLKKMSGKILVEAEVLKESFDRKHGENVAVNKISRFIHARVKKILMSLDA